MKRRLMIIIPLIILILIIVAGIIDCNCGAIYKYEKPEELVPYDKIINDYQVKVEGTISQQEVQEIFTILKNVREAHVEGQMTGDPIRAIELSGMKIIKTEDGIIKIINVTMSKYTSGTAGFTTYLKFRRNWLGQWILIENSFSIS
jgi:hypothetical protein